MSDDKTIRASVEISWPETTRVMRRFLCPETPLCKSVCPLQLGELKQLIEKAQLRLAQARLDEDKG